jgi:hypothetical protein
LVASNRQWASRLASEIIAAVVAGESLPDEWENLKCYEELGEPEAVEVVRFVMDDLASLGIHPYDEKRKARS